MNNSARATNDFIEGRRAEAEGRKPVYHGD
jgi:hypothetical protein